MRKIISERIQFTLTTLVLLVAFLVGCTEEPMVEQSANLLGTFTLKMADKQEVSTRATKGSVNENTIDNLYVLQYRNTGTSAAPSYTYVAGEKLNIADQLSGNGLSEITVSSGLMFETNDRVVVLANTNVDKLPDFKVGVDTENEINAKFTSAAWSLNRVGEEIGRGMPMSGRIDNWAATGNSCKMKRSVAKIQVKVDLGSDNVSNDLSGAFTGTNFHAIVWGVYNQVEQGNVHSVSDESIVIPSNKSFIDNLLKIKPVGSGAIASDAFYMPEFPSSTHAKLTTVPKNVFNANRTCLILSTKAGYYRLDLLKDSEFLDIKRNHNYTLNITKVRNKGYSSLAEALANAGSNIEYAITVDDNDLSSIISNGQYGIGVVNDDVTVYGTTNRVHIVTKVKALDLPSAVITNKISTTSGIELVSPAKLTSNLANIEVKFTSSTINEGVITLELGNIHKEITVKRESRQYGKVRIFGAANNLDYGYNVSIPHKNKKWGNGSNRVLTAPVNFGPDGTVSCEPVEFFLPDRSNTANDEEDLFKAIDAKVDIIVIGYDLYLKQHVADRLAQYVKDKGVLVMFCEGNGGGAGVGGADGSVTNFMRALWGINTITSKVVNQASYHYPDTNPTFHGSTGGMLYRIDPDSKVSMGDPVLDGPFTKNESEGTDLELRGRHWGEDAVYARAVKGLPAEDIVVYSDALVGNCDITLQDPAQKDLITGFRHKKHNLVFFGDGGFIASPIIAVDATAHERTPFMWDSNYRPALKSGYGAGRSGYIQTKVYNAHLFANIMAWAIERATNNGINTPKP